MKDNTAKLNWLAEVVENSLLDSSELVELMGITPQDLIEAFPEKALDNEEKIGGYATESFDDWATAQRAYQENTYGRSPIPWSDDIGNDYD